MNSDLLRLTVLGCATDTAGAARAARLIVTHVGRFLTPQQAVQRAATRFDGPIDCAAPGTTFSIG